MEQLKDTAEKDPKEFKLKDILKYVSYLILALIFFVFGVQYIFISSPAFEASFDFVRDEKELIEEVGEIEDMGWWITGRLQTTSGDNGTSGNAFFNYKVIGTFDEATVHVELEKAVSDNYWEVTDFYFDK